jgi:hypothetical protein
VLVRRSPWGQDDGAHIREHAASSAMAVRLYLSRRMTVREFPTQWVQFAPFWPPAVAKTAMSEPGSVDGVHG